MPGYSSRFMKAKDPGRRKTFKNFKGDDRPEPVKRIRAEKDFPRMKRPESELRRHRTEGRETVGDDKRISEL